MSHSIIFKTIITIFVAFAVIYCLLFLKQDSKIIPLAQEGVLDCSGWDFESDGKIVIEGEWEFYWEALYSPTYFEKNQIPTQVKFTNFPGLWNNISSNRGYLSNHGFATYRLKIINSQFFHKMAIEIPDFYSSYQLWINGETIAKNGQVGTSHATTTPHWLPQTKPIELSQPINEIVLQIANFHHSKGGAAKAPSIGLNKNLQDKHKAETSTTLMLFGALIMGSLFFIGLYLFGRREKAGLYFSLFCLSYCYRVIGSKLYVLHDFFPELSWWITTKLEYITLYLSVSFFLEFVNKVFRGEFYLPLIRACHLINGTLCFFTIFFSAKYFTQVIDPYLGLVFILVLYGLFVLIRAMINKKEGADFAVLSFVALLMTFNLIVLDYFNISKFSAVLSFLGYISFFFFQSLILSRKFAVSYKKAVEAAEEGSRIKSDFLATMSHEIRTPMNGMIGMTSLLAQTELTAEQRKFTDIIRISGENLLTIINDILDFSKIESQNMELEYQVLDVESAIVEIVDLFSLQASKAGLSINYQIAEEVPTYVIGDVTRLKQIIINLINNAIKFTEEGEICIRISKEAAQNKKDLYQLRFDVEDTGIGIEATKKDRLFAPFSQADSSIARKYGGTGLGLAICQKLVYLMKGNIWVESKLGKGTLVSFNAEFGIPSNTEIEKVKPKSKPVAITTERLSDLIPLRILVVEDNAINLKLMLFILKKEGYVADSAGNGQEALNAFNHQTYDIVLMDMQMPVMDGIEATKRIVAKYPEKERPTIIALTANVSKEDREKCYAVGMSDFITKPIKAGTIRELLIKWGKQIQPDVQNILASNKIL